MNELTEEDLLERFEELLKNYPPEIPVDVDNFLDSQYDKYDIKYIESLDDTYCSCKKPDAYKNFADGKGFYFCRICKKERL